MIKLIISLSSRLILWEIQTNIILCHQWGITTGVGWQWVRPRRLKGSTRKLWVILIRALYPTEFRGMNPNIMEAWFSTSIVISHIYLVQDHQENLSAALKRKPFLFQRLSPELKQWLSSHVTLKRNSNWAI